MWVVYYVAVLTIGRYPEYQKSILWLGGAIVTVLTLVPMLRNGERLPAEAWLLFTFLLWSVAGFYMIEDTRGFLQRIRVNMQALVILSCVGIVIRRSGAATWFYWGFIVVAAFNVLVGLKSIGVGMLLADSPEAVSRDAGLTGNANALGYFCFLGFWGGVALWGEKRSWLTRAAIVTGGAVALYGVVVSASRGAFLSVMVAAALWGGLCLRAGVRNRLYLMFALVGVGGVFLLFGRFVVQRTYTGQRLASIAEMEDGSSLTRLELARTGLELALQNPIQGVGTGQFAVASGTGRDPHSEMVELLSTTGLIGFLLYSAIYVVAWRRVSLALRRSTDPLVQYRGNLVRVMIINLVMAGALFRPNYLSIDSINFLALAVGLSEWVAAQAGPVQRQSLLAQEKASIVVRRCSPRIV